MIDYHVDRPIAEDPYIEPINLETFKRYDKMIELLERLTNYSERQREKAAPTIIDLSPTAGGQVTSGYVTTERLRIEGIFISGGGTDKLQIKFGSRPFVFFANNLPYYFPFPYTVDRGTDILMSDITNPGAATWTGYIFAYSE